MKRRGILAPARAAMLAAATLMATWSCGPRTLATDGYRVVATYPHDPAAYCQGLLYADGVLYESTGRNGTSSVRRVALETGEVLASAPLPWDLFGEGLALHDGELFQLTWHAGMVHVFDPATLRVTRNLRYDGEGWGLASDGTHLIQSDGTDVLRVRDPETFEVVRRIRVTAGGRPLSQLNELEFVEGELWANLWKRDTIARIDPETGDVRGWIDLSGIFDPTKIPDEDAVLNGIAYDPEGKRLFVTGKLWPKLFEIEVVPR